MHFIDLLADRAVDERPQLGIRRSDGSEVPVRVTLLSFDACEFESAEDFAVDEQVSIHMHRMGWIRARITSVEPPLAKAEFAIECLV